MTHRQCSGSALILTSRIWIRIQNADPGPGNGIKERKQKNRYKSKKKCIQCIKFLAQTERLKSLFIMSN